MTTARYGVESISIWCPECHEFQGTRNGSQQFTETEVERLPAVMECQYCGEQFRKPTWPEQRRQKR